MPKPTSRRGARFVLFLSAVLALIIGLSGGCSAFVPWEQTVTIRTLPDGVPIKVDGQDRGPSPVTLDLRRDESHTIVAAAPGSLYTRELHRKVSTTGALDIAGGAVFLVPGLGLLAPGAWDLDGTDLTLDLRATSPASDPTTRPSVAGAIVTLPVRAMAQ